jgi:hypothetical protein
LRVLGRLIGSAGHEVITRAAIGGGTISFSVGGRPMSATLSATDIADIILGNRSVDLGAHDADDSGRGITTSFNPSEQRRHALRATLTQPQPAARADIVSEFGRAHGAIIGERDPRRRMRRIGVALHLIQDAFSPAHVERDPSRGWCMRYIRNFGRGSSPAEHSTPSDPRDSVTAAASAAARAQATAASQRYLQIVFKALRGALGPDPLAAGEAARELAAFASDVFRPC